MSDEPTAPPPSSPKVSVQVDDAIKHGTYANFLVVSHSPHEFTLDFCQVLPRGDGDGVTADVVSRVRIAPTMVARVLGALNTNMASYEEKFGQVRAIG